MVRVLAENLKGGAWLMEFLNPNLCTIKGCSNLAVLSWYRMALITTILPI